MKKEIKLKKMGKGDKGKTDLFELFVVLKEIDFQV